MSAVARERGGDGARTRHEPGGEMSDTGCALCGSTWGDYDAEIDGVWFHF